MSEPADSIRRRLEHMLGAHSDSPQWYQNQIQQTLRWLDEYERRANLHGTHDSARSNAPGNH